MYNNEVYNCVNLRTLKHNLHFQSSENKQMIQIHLLCFLIHLFWVYSNQKLSDRKVFGFVAWSALSD